jgi:hypothetical protein
MIDYPLPLLEKLAKSHNWTFVGLNIEDGTITLKKSFGGVSYSPIKKGEPPKPSLRESDRDRNFSID